MIFDPPMEKANLIISLLFIPWAAFDLFYPITVKSELGFWGQWIVAYVFMNSTHGALTFVMMASMPEFGAWAKTRTRWLKIRRGHLAAIALSGIFLFGLYRALTTSFAPAREWILYLFLPLLYLRATHILWQIRGLAAMYNHNALMAQIWSADELTRVRRHWDIERKLFGGLALTLVLTLLLALQPRMPILPGFIGKNIDYLWTLRVAFALGIIINAHLTPRSELSNKTLFLFRTIYVAFGFSLINAYACRSLHGVEYLGLYQKMRTRSAWKPSAWMAYAIPAVSFTIAALLHLSYNFRWWLEPMLGNIALVFAAIYFLFEYGHFFVDAIIFRFRNPDIRKTIAPLVMEEARTSIPSRLPRAPSSSERSPREHPAA